MSGHYILNESHEVIPVDMMTWVRWFETNLARKRVRLTRVGKYKVSTVFLGSDHAFGGGPPLLFETMAFDGKIGGNEVCCRRCSTWDQAVVQHIDVVDSLKEHDTQETEEL